MFGAGAAGAYFGGGVVRRRGRYPDSQVRGAYFSYVGQGGMGLCESVCGVQSLCQFSSGQLQGGAVQSAF